MTDVVVLGSGMVGVATALQLARRGHAVCLVDRRQPGQETSYGNAGIVQSEAMVPYAFPRDWPTLLQAALRRSTAIHYRLQDLPQLLAPLVRYWQASGPARHELAIQGHGALIHHALSAHRELMADCVIDDLVRRDGYRWAFRSQRALDVAAGEASALQQRFGVRHKVLDARELALAEPGLHGTSLVGAIHWPDPWTVAAPGELVSAYARHCQVLGGLVLQGDANSLQASGNRWQVDTDLGVVQARHAVIALGPWSKNLTDRLGYRLPLFVKRGYHRHFVGGPPLQAPLLDAERGYVLAPMRQGIRLTTGAELARLDAPASLAPMQMATRSARELLHLPQQVESVPWLGNRPCTPDMLPVLGAAPGHERLWFNFGHAHQGFTLGPVCGQLIADLIEGRQPLVDTAPYAAARFGSRGH